jgi:radical SAM superfamily enzyme YgiQ (UPF0313 family)
VRAVLVNPDYPETYWSLRHTLPLVDRRWLVAPLPLLTVAALLPSDWEVRLVDLTFESISDEELRAADVVLLSGMIVQQRSLHEVLARCRRLGVRTVVGGPYATAQPERLPDADHLVLGEAEEVLPPLASQLERGAGQRVWRADRRPDLRLSPVPRFELARRGAYHYMAIQFSRGCPFQCEFCDVISLYGRVPRTKSAAQVLAELDAIRRSGFRGRVMFVDDNFIGAKKEARALLRELGAWWRRTGAPFEFFTEASIDLADRPELVEAMVEAGFAVVFIGIETPNAAALREARKRQNLGRDVAGDVRALRRRGLDVWAGFILGFDHDGPETFEAMVQLVQDAGIPYAMVGMLMALPGTALHARLAREGRLRPGGASGDMFADTNVATRIPRRELLAGYARVLETLYAPEAYFARCREHLRHWEPPPGPKPPIGRAELAVAARSLWHQGVCSRYRRAYWRFLASGLRRHPRKLSHALAQACAGHHFVTYTRETVIPRLAAELARAGQPAEAGQEAAPGEPPRIGARPLRCTPPLEPAQPPV